MLMHYGFAFPPNVNKHSFLEVNKEELRYNNITNFRCLFLDLQSFLVYLVRFPHI